MIHRSAHHNAIKDNVIFGAFLFFAIFSVATAFWFLTRSEFAPNDLEPTATGKTTIDVMVLYNGAAAGLYNNRPETRINHLIDVSNQIYDDSGVNLSLRLVHTEKVNYESGYDSTSAVRHLTNQSHPAFENVPDLRTRYGADLVVLMRPYSDDGYCGLAWVGGADTNGDFSDRRQKKYGFSHVSIDCGTYVLSHELGHNMGLNHSRLQTKKGGTFDYALGHGVQNDFVTIMAYASAFNAGKVKLFSSPTLDCGSAACGIDRNRKDGADAVYTLNITTPQIANYYESVAQIQDNWTSTKYDTDGNGTSDVILHHIDGSWNLNTISGTKVTSVRNLSLEDDPDWQAVGREDYNGDGMADILIRNSSTGKWKLYLLEGDKIVKKSKVSMTGNLDWSVAGSGDFDGDGMGDVLLRNSDGRWYQYFLKGTDIRKTSRPALPEDSSYETASTGDFDGDGKTDILLRNATGGWHLYLMDGGDITNDKPVSMKKNLAWQVMGSGDFTGNEIDDLLLRYKNGNWLIYSFEDFNASTKGFVNMTSDLDWESGSIGDFDADGTTDIIVRNELFGTWKLYNPAQSAKNKGKEVGLTTDLNWTPSS